MHKSVQAKVNEIFKQSRYLSNLGICVLLWFSTFMMYHTFSGYEFAHKITESIFDEMLINSGDDLLGFLSAGLVFGKILARKKFVFLWAYLICFVGLVGCVLTNSSQRAQKTDLIFMYIGKFGIACAYQGCFLITEIFPSIIYSTSFGICNIFGVIATIIVTQVFPQVFLLDQYFEKRLIVCGVMIALACIACPFIKGSHYIKL